MTTPTLPTLQGKTLTLRPLQLADAEALFKMQNDAAFMQLFSAHQPRLNSLAEMQAVLGQRLSVSPFQLGVLQWMVIHPRYGTIGTVVLSNYQPDNAQAEGLLGLFAHRQRGYGVEATLLMLECAFQHLQLYNFYAWSYDYNPTIRAMLKRLDFLDVGTQPDAKGPLHRSTLLRSEYFRSVTLRRLAKRWLGREPTPPKPPPSADTGPFSCQYTAELPALLQHLHAVIAISIHTAERVILLSSDGEKLQQLPRKLANPQTLAARGKQQLAVALQCDTLVFANTPALAPSYPNQPQTYDALFLPRAHYYCGELGIRDMAWLGDELWIASSRLSCLAVLNDQCSISPRWYPPFIQAFAGESQCYLSGFAAVDGQPTYATVWAQTNAAHGWQQHIQGGGSVLRVHDGAVIAAGLSLPSAPRWHQGHLYVLNAGAGQLMRLDPATGHASVLCELPGWLQGLALIGEYAVIGLGKIPARSLFAQALPLAQQTLYCGIAVVHLATGREVARLTYLNDAVMDRVNDVCVLRGIKRAGLVSFEQPVHRLALTTPDTGFWLR